MALIQFLVFLKFYLFNFYLVIFDFDFNFFIDFVAFILVAFNNFGFEFSFSVNFVKVS